jgi:glucose-6-phosphate isomerase
MCGIDIRRMLDGAGAMDIRVRKPNWRENPAALIAAIHYLYMRRGKLLHVMMPYSHQLKDLADWYRQLWAESLGKENTLDNTKADIGPTPIRALGATDQHSQLQLYREGPNDKVITTLAVDRYDRQVSIPAAFDDVEALGYLGGKSLAELLQKERLATEQALLDSRRPVLTVRFPRVCEETVGQFIYLYECAVSIMGLLLRIDAYDQPAVELIKEYTRALMGRSGEKYDKLRELLAVRMKANEEFVV